MADVERHDEPERSGNLADGLLISGEPEYQFEPDGYRVILGRISFGWNIYSDTESVDSRRV